MDRAIFKTAGLTADDLTAMLAAADMGQLEGEHRLELATPLGADVVRQAVGAATAQLFMVQLELEGKLEASAARDAELKGHASIVFGLIESLGKHDRAAYAVWREWFGKVKGAPEVARAQAARKAAEAARAARGMETCDRCGGAGGWSGWPGFTCYKCHGQGELPMLATV